VRWSVHNKSRLYATLNGYRNDDFSAYVFVTEDLGKTWTSINNGLSQAVNVILEDPENENVLYVGTDNNLFVSLDRGKTFVDFSSEIPNVAVHDLVIQKTAKDLIVGTHGRSLYKANVSFLQSLKQDVLNKKKLVIKEIKPITYSDRWGKKGYTWGTTYEPKLYIWFYLSEISTTITTIKSKSGVVVFNSGDKAINGIQNKVYDLSIDEKTAKLLETKTLKIAKSENGKYYLPVGNYTVEVEANGTKESSSFEIKETKK
jgi:hypothetical protein